MISEYRQHFNTQYRPEQYAQFMTDIERSFGYSVEFKISETPIFIPNPLKNKLLEAAQEIYSSLNTPDYFSQSQRAIPPNCLVPNEKSTPDFLAIDFAICQDKNGDLIPKLIELQGFPSLYCFQKALNDYYRKHYEISENVTNFFNGLSAKQYLEILRNKIVANENPENVILLEIEPQKQKTRIDFDCCEQMIGVRSVCLTEITKRGKKLFYKSEDKEIPIHRIYNRVIFDELQARTDLQPAFRLTDEVEVDWAGHPNWFFKMSKFSLPFLNSKYVPKTYFLNDLKELPTDLSNYVLKPLFSFAGAGVKFDLQLEDLMAIPEGEKPNYILMEKVQYEPLVQTLDVPAKVEIRLLTVCNSETNRLEVLTNLVRLSKGKMMGVDFNKNKTWVGGTLGYFEY